jgi:hypothetical protein
MDQSTLAAIKSLLGPNPHKMTLSYPLVLGSAKELLAEVELLRPLVAEVAELIVPCPLPNIAHGETLCPCDNGELWPCKTTWLGWRLRGLDPNQQAAEIRDQAEQAPVDSTDPEGAGQ